MSVRVTRLVGVLTTSREGNNTTSIEVGTRGTRQNDEEGGEEQQQQQQQQGPLAPCSPGVAAHEKEEDIYLMQKTGREQIRGKGGGGQRESGIVFR